MSDLQLRTLGSLWAGRGDGGGPVFHGGKTCLLLAVLASRADEWSDREHLSQLLWPSRSRERRRHSLRELLSRIRTELSSEAFEECPEGLRLNLKRWWVDCVEYEQALREKRWGDAAELYHGPFGGAHEPDGGVELRAVVDSVQARLHTEATDCLRGLIAQALDEGDTAEAERWARRYVEVDPMSEEARLHLIQVLRASDRCGDALAVFEEYRVLLDELVEADTSRQLRAVAEDLRDLAGDVRHPLAGEGPPVQEANSADAGHARRGARRRRTVRWLLGSGLMVAVSVSLLLSLDRTSGEGASSRNVPLLARVVGNDGRPSVVGLVIEPSGVAVQAADDPVGVLGPSKRYIAVEATTPYGRNVEVLSASDRSVVVERATPWEEAFLAWAPDGRALLYRSTALSPTGTSYAERLGVMSVPDGSVRPFGFEARSLPQAAWSPKGTLVAVSAATDADYDLYVFAASGALNTRLTLPGDQMWPVWSPSGRWLAFENQVEGDAGIHLLSVGDSVSSVLVSGPQPQHHLVWLQDTLMVFLQGRGDDVELHVINPFSDAGSHELETGLRLRSLEWRSPPVAPGAWVERIAAVPGRIQASVHQEVVMRIGAWDRTGDPLELETADVLWASSDPEIAQAAADGRVHALRIGTTTVTASLSGWRTATVPVEVRPLVEVDVEQVWHEDWAEGITPERWVLFGDPLPYTSLSGPPDGGGALVSNGDGNHDSGVISRRALGLSQGLTVEFWAAQPTTGGYFQDIRVGLHRAAAPDEFGELAHLSTPIAWYRTDSFHESVHVGVGESFSELPLPGDAGEWHRYGLQVESDGLVTMVMDNRPIWRGRSPYQTVMPDSAYLVLGGCSVDTEILHGPVTVYRGAKYRLER